MSERDSPKNQPSKSDSEGGTIMELKTKHPGEWILILKDGSYVHADKLEGAYAQVPDTSKIKITLRPYKPQELLLY
jgi:hypothetical protein